MTKKVPNSQIIHLAPSFQPSSWFLDFQWGLPSRIYWTGFCIPASSPFSPINRGCRGFTLNGTADNVSIFPRAVRVYPVNPIWPEEVISPVNSDQPLSRRCCLCLVLYDIVENHALINTQAPLVDCPPLSPCCSTKIWWPKSGETPSGCNSHGPWDPKASGVLSRQGESSPSCAANVLCFKYQRELLRSHRASVSMCEDSFS